MQALKALVITMAVLIFAGIGLLVYGLATRTGPETGGGDVTLSIPDGCHVFDSSLADGILMLTLDGPEDRGCQQILLIEAESGRLMTRLSIASEGQP